MCTRYFIALGAFFPVLMNTIAGVRNVDAIYVRVAQNLGARPATMFRRVLLPGGAERPVQFVDARDLAAWILAAARRGLAGTFNACGPAERTGMGVVFDACAAVSGSGARPAWTDERALIDAGVEPWSELPLWVGEGATPTDAGFMQISSARAIAEGLAFRPVEEVVRDTLEWDRGHPEFRSAAALTPEREAELLAALAA